MRRAGAFSRAARPLAVVFSVLSPILTNAPATASPASVTRKTIVPLALDPDNESFGHIC